MRLINRKKCGLLTANFIFPFREIFLSLHRRVLLHRKTSTNRIMVRYVFSSEKSNIIRQINEKYHDLADYGSKLHSQVQNAKVLSPGCILCFLPFTESI